ncbi:hypothetical protein AYI69_g3616 [Smittium culicis]|uniref:Uncharacterized protein n=1 Tax=Smittium culicis TaxID=133412 RepID=A0A1R1YJA4_9FUNG|nr:hypothetical protein AYI69_g3616 [Smittium culicis]
MLTVLYSEYVGGENRYSSRESHEQDTIEAQECYPADHSGLEHGSILGPPIRRVVSGPEEHFNPSTNQDTSVSSHPRPEKRENSDNEQQDMFT